MKSVKSGFTIIELLVVVAIIAILAAIIFPVISAAKNTGKTATCKANLKQIGTALQLYRDDWNSLQMMRDIKGFLVWGGEQKGWAEKLFKYHNKIDVYKCPARKVNFAYSLNERLSNPASSFPVRPSAFMAVFEVPGTGKGTIDVTGQTKNLPRTGDANLADGFQEDGYVYGPSPKMNPNIKISTYQWYSDKDTFPQPHNFHRLYFPGPHNGASNVLFYDGHVESFKDWQAGLMTFRPRPNIR
ncbi:MAG: prepilin-type N-terminal cleavage/methylation domain-containing protein [Armatimonadota bacterium]